MKLYCSCVGHRNGYVKESYFVALSLYPVIGFIFLENTMLLPMDGKFPHIHGSQCLYECIMKRKPSLLFLVSTRVHYDVKMHRESISYE